MVWSPRAWTIGSAGALSLGIAQVWLRISDPKAVPATTVLGLTGVVLAALAILVLSLTALAREASPADALRSATRDLGAVAIIDLLLFLSADRVAARGAPEPWVHGIGAATVLLAVLTAVCWSMSNLLREH